MTSKSARERRKGRASQKRSGGISQGIRFDHLGPTDFESLCFDLLSAIGATRLSWRKGAVSTSGAADQGRDIEAQFRYSGPGGEAIDERRFVECKHMGRAVPVSELADAIAWATAETPDSLHFIVSGALSNPAKDHLEALRRNQKPRFRIIVWESSDLVQLVRRHSRLLTKYHLAETSPILTLLHPSHVAYLERLPLFGLQTLFGVLDQLAPIERSTYLSWVRDAIILPRLRNPRTGKESYSELLLDPVDYETFRRKCYALDVADEFLATSIIASCLHSTFRIAHGVGADESKQSLADMISFSERRLTQGVPDPGSLRAVIESTRRYLDDFGKLPYQVDR